MKQVRIPAVFMRGGTSKALFFHQKDLPSDCSQWTPLLLDAMGSPDPNGRQLDGMGGGISSLSKACIIGPPTRPDADVDYTFAQVSVTEGSVDYSGNCGNMSAAVGPFAIDEGLVPASGDAARVVIHNTNTHKLILAHFPIEAGLAAVEGDFCVAGVAGSGATVQLEFIDPGGTATGTLLPTGNPIDELVVPGPGIVAASMVDATNPCVFIDAAALGLTATEAPDEIEADSGLMNKLELMRIAASVRMGIAADAAAASRMASIPKIALVGAPRAAKTLSGETLDSGAADLTARMISIGRPHRAIPLTGAMCLAVASRITGTVAQRLVHRSVQASGNLRIGQPSGVIEVGAVVRENGNSWVVEKTIVCRTARRLMDGWVLVRGSALMVQENEM